MTPGIPGAGIGGLFYVCSSVVLAGRYGWRRMRGVAQAGEAGAVALLLLLTGGIALGVWLAGWLLGLVISPEQLQVSRANLSAPAPGSSHNVIRIAAVVVAVGTLIAVLACVELARFLTRIKAATRRPITDSPNARL